MTDLSDFGGGADPLEQPQIERKRVRWTPDNANNSNKIAGFVGVIRNRGEHGEKCYTTRRLGQHFYQRHDAWAISTRILNTIGQLDVTFIIVWDGNTGNAWEYRAQTFRDAPLVPDEDLEVASDPQRFVPADDALRFWDEAGESMFKRDFEAAMDYCLN